MKVKEFINKCETSKDLDKTMEEVVTVTYLPYAEKINLCEKILNTTCYTNTEPKLFKINSPARKMLLMLSFVDKYTDIEIDWNNVLQDFDDLSRSHYIGMLLSKIDEAEIQQCYSILEMMLDDLITNERDLVSYIDTKIEAARLAFETISSAITPEMVNELVSKVSE